MRLPCMHAAPEILLHGTVHAGSKCSVQAARPLACMQVITEEVEHNMRGMMMQDKRKRGEEWSGPDYLAMVVPPVLNSLVDADARVRYYACEALYNIAKVGSPALPPRPLTASGDDEALQGQRGCSDVQVTSREKQPRKLAASCCLYWSCWCASGACKCT